MAAGCAIQLPALLAIGLMLIRGRYSVHPLIFWLVIVLAVLATWSWSVERSGKRAKSERVAMVLELARNLAVASSWIASIVGIVMAFV
jgi:uncharacterized membrane protein